MRNIAGTLSYPNGTAVANGVIHLVAKRNEPSEIVKGVSSSITCSGTGQYNADIEDGYYAVSLEVFAGMAQSHRTPLGSILVEPGASVTLNYLLQFSEDPGSDIIGQMQAIYDATLVLANQVAADKVEVEADKNAAAASATSASNSATSATNSANAADADRIAAQNAANTASTQAGVATTKAGEAATSATNSGNSATAAAQSASEADDLADDAAASALAAANSAASTAGVVTAAENARDAAIAAKTASETARDQSVTAKDQSIAAKNAAETAETNAETAAGSASTSATAAGNSATAAAASANDAEGFKDQAESSATSAASSAGAASGSAGAAAGSAGDASSSASAAASSEADAETARDQAVAAENKAEQWATNPVDDPVELGKFSALHHATKAATSANTSAENAESADMAMQSSQQFRDEAEGFKNTATTQASQASDSAAEAVSAAGGANTAQLAAEAARDDAAIHQTNAEAAAGEAALWENIAMQFAQNPEDVPVVDGDSNPIGFSALHYAAKAEESAAGGITPGTVLDFLTNKVGAPFSNSSTMNQALQSLVNLGLGSVTGEIEYLDSIADFAGMLAVPNGKPFMITGLSTTANYLVTATTGTTSPYTAGNGNSRDFAIKLGSSDVRNAAATQVVKKIYLLVTGQVGVISSAIAPKLIVLTYNTITTTSGAATFSLLLSSALSTNKFPNFTSAITRAGDFGLGVTLDLDNLSVESGGSWTSVTPNMVRNTGFFIGKMDQANYMGSGAAGNIVTVFGVGGGPFSWSTSLLFCVNQSGRLFVKYGDTSTGWMPPQEVLTMETLVTQRSTIKNALQINSVSPNDFYIASDFVNSVNNGGDFIGNTFSGGSIANPTLTSEFPNNAQGIVKLLSGTTIGSGASILAGYAAGGGGIRSMAGLKASIIFRCPQPSVQNYGFNWGLLTVNSELGGGTSAICVKKEPGSFDFGLFVRYANTNLHNSYAQGMLPNTDYQLTLEIYSRTSDGAIFVRMSIYENPYGPNPNRLVYEDVNLDALSVPMGIQYFFGFIGTGITGTADTTFAIDFMEVGMKNMQRGINVFNLVTP